MIRNLLEWKAMLGWAQWNWGGESQENAGEVVDGFFLAVGYVPEEFRTGKVCMNSYTV